jgi:hypothetical protein
VLPVADLLSYILTGKSGSDDENSVPFLIAHGIKNNTGRTIR